MSIVVRMKDFSPPMFRRRLRNTKRMRLSIKHPFVQTNNVWLAENEEEVFERFGHPETLRYH